jgi:AAA domain
VPSSGVLNDEFPGLGLPELREGQDFEDATGWLVERLQKRFVTNQVQEMLRKAAKDSVLDPEKVLRDLRADADRLLSTPGNIGMGSNGVRLLPMTEVADDAPVWAWERQGQGAIQVGTLVLLAGRPGAGKSTAARYFAARFSRGDLDGFWKGQPQNVAYIAPAEESMKYVIKPGLRAAGADIERVFFPEVLHDGKVARLRSARDEEALVEQLLANQVTVVIVDPLMSTIGTGVDIHRNNETREHLEPWSRIADKIEGVVLGVTHLRKETRGSDIVAAITGSSAFGEVARAVLGFAKDHNSNCRVMSQVKNSTGPEDLSLAYRIEAEVVTTDTGSPARVGKFVIEGNSERSVADLLNQPHHHDRGPTAVDEAREWLHDYLTLHGRSRSSEVKEQARESGHSQSATKKAATELGVVMKSEGFPRITYWSLPPKAPGAPQDIDPPGVDPGQPQDPGEPGDVSELVSVGSQSVQHTNTELTEPTEPTGSEEAPIRTTCTTTTQLGQSVQSVQSDHPSPVGPTVSQLDQMATAPGFSPPGRNSSDPRGETSYPAPRGEPTPVPGCGPWAPGQCVECGEESGLVRQTSAICMACELLQSVSSSDDAGDAA